MIWDAVGTEFGGRHELYEINYGGNTENIRLEMVKFADAMGDSDKYRSFVDQALSEYDLAGWTVDSWINPEKELIEQ
jgi:4-hydroxyphenylacetate 3-monooxygenase